MRVQKPESLKECLINAACHARSVMARDHIVPERIVRVGEFITCIRREFQYGYAGGDKKSILKFITQAGTWSDILEYKTREQSYYCSDSELRLDIEAIVGSAVEELQALSPKSLELGLSEMDKQASASLSFARRATEINKEADIILQEFNDLFEEMSS